MTDATGLVADVGGTNTRLGRVDGSGVLNDTVVKLPNGDYDSFTAMAQEYLAGQSNPDRVAIAVAGPVAGQTAKLTNRDWDFDSDLLVRDLQAGSVLLMNDLEALGAAVPTVPEAWVEPLSEGAVLRGKGQALVVGLGTGFNVSMVETTSGVAFCAEQGHASLPSTVMRYLGTKFDDLSLFDTVENLFSGVGMLRLANALGFEADSAAAIAGSEAPIAREAVDICTDAFGIMVRELAYTYFPRAGFFFNGSLASLLLSPERRDRVLAPLRADDSFEGQFSTLPTFRFTSDSVALGGCAARLLRQA